MKTPNRNCLDELGVNVTEGAKRKDSSPPSRHPGAACVVKRCACLNDLLRLFHKGNVDPLPALC